MVLGIDGEYNLDRWSEKQRGITQSQGGKEHPTYNVKKEGYLDWLFVIEG
jgi:hypothetical protein